MLSQLVARRLSERLLPCERLHHTKKGGTWGAALPACRLCDVGLSPASGGVTTVPAPPHQSQSDLPCLMRLAKWPECANRQSVFTRGRPSSSHCRLAQHGDAALLINERRHFKTRQQAPLWCVDSHHKKPLAIGTLNSPAGHARLPNHRRDSTVQPTTRLVRAGWQIKSQTSLSTCDKGFRPANAARIDGTVASGDAVAANFGPLLEVVAC